MLRLKVTVGPDKGKEVELEEGVITLGRESANTFSVADPRVSGQHGEIRKIPGGYAYRDLGSTNGSVLERGGQQRIIEPEEEVPLAPGDRLRLGPVTIVEVDYEPEREAQETVRQEWLDELLQQMRQDRERLEAIYRLESQVGLAFDLDDLLERMVEAIAEVFDQATHVVVLLWDEEKQEFVPRAGYDRTTGQRSPEAIAVSRSVIRDIVETREAKLYVDVLEDLPVSEGTRALQVRSTICVPLWVENRVMGIVQVDNRQVKGAFKPEDLYLLAVFARHAAMALQGALLQEQRRLAQIGALAAAIDHDIKNWMWALTESAEVLEECLAKHFAALERVQMAAEKGKLAPEVLRELGRERDLCFRLLEVMRVEAERAKEVALQISEYAVGRSPTPTFGEVDVNEEIEKVVKLIQPRTRRLQVELGDLPPIQADASLLFRAVYNLADNAVTATALKGEVTLRTRAEPAGEFPEGGYVEIEVADTGVGMKEEEVANLFTEEGVRVRGRGTGLGLQIVKSVVEAHGGTIRVESREGEGTTFGIKLPI
ncbi:MAG TPA: FHA domain-containing protein [Armatimonadetes bacterium]|nr:FHA domain-containing protein [Armatimonadota bacterium]